MTKIPRKKKHGIKDEFHGDDAELCDCIKALVEMNDDGILTPHGIGGHARALLAASFIRLSPTKRKVVSSR